MATKYLGKTACFDTVEAALDDVAAGVGFMQWTSAAYTNQTYNPSYTTCQHSCTWTRNGSVGLKCVLTSAPNSSFCTATLERPAQLTQAYVPSACPDANPTLTTGEVTTVAWGIVTAWIAAAAIMFIVAAIKGKAL